MLRSLNSLNIFNLNGNNNHLTINFMNIWIIIIGFGFSVFCECTLEIDKKPKQSYKTFKHLPTYKT